MEHIPSGKADSSWAAEYIPRILRNQNDQCRVHENPPLNPILKQNTVHILVPYF
jgi:hypothetical protein